MQWRGSIAREQTRAAVRQNKATARWSGKGGSKHRKGKGREDKGKIQAPYHGHGDHYADLDIEYNELAMVQDATDQYDSDAKLDHNDNDASLDHHDHGDQDATLDHHDQDATTLDHGDHDELPHSLTANGLPHSLTALDQLHAHMQMPAHPKAPQQSLSMGALIKMAQLAIIQDRKQDALHYLGLLRDALSNCYLDAPKLEKVASDCGS